MLNDFFTVYHKLKNGIPLETITKTKYKEYVSYLKVKEDNISYWKEYLNDFTPISNLPIKIASSKPLISTQTVSLKLNSTTCIYLRQLVKDHNLSLANVFYFAWGLLFQKYLDCNDIVFGTTVSGRSIPLKGIDQMIGLFINTIPLRIKNQGNDTVLKPLHDISKDLRERVLYENTPLVNIWNLVSNEGEKILFDSIVLIENYPFNDDVIENPVGVSLKGFSFDQTNNFDLSLSILLFEDIEFYFSYNQDAYRREDINAFSERFCYIIDQISRHPNKKVQEIEILTTDEKKNILNTFNITERKYDSNYLLHELIEQQVRKTPDSVALYHKGNHITYNYLDRQSKKIAYQLQLCGCKVGSSLIGIYMERSVEMIFSILGILHSGAAYVPFESSLPSARVRKIANSLQLEYLITDKTINKIADEIDHIDSLKYILVNGRKNDYYKISSRIELILLANLPDEICYSKHFFSSKEIAYIIFTSGSTGEPKGVVVSHKSVLNVIDWVNREYNVGKDDHFLFVSSVGFDLSVYDIFGGLAAGAQLCIVSGEDIANSAYLFKSIINLQITFWNSAPALLQQLELVFKEKEIPRNSLRLIFLSGDWIPLELSKVIKNKFSTTEFIALGGATEATIWSNYYRIDEINPSWKSIPYGKPIQNSKYYILNSNLQPVPIGIPGDLYINGSDCLALGYVNDLVLTRNKFIDSPFKKGDILYKTGDIAKWFEDGNIEFLGRKDNQVKIRGYRIELGEIENQLLVHDKINDVAVIAREREGDKYLVAYYVSTEEIDASELKTFLSQGLPNYMIPTYFVHLLILPLTPNGKIDKKGLPNPEIKEDDNYAAPSNEIEEKLVDIWSKILFIDKELISVNKCFFELGGHSILAIRLLNQINNSFGVELDLPTFIKNPTIKVVSSILESNCEKKEVLPEIIVDRDNWYKPFRLTDIQQAYWIGRKDLFEFGSIGTHAYGEFYIKELNIERFNTVFNALVKRHGMLRMVITSDGQQQILEKVPFYEIKVQDLKQLSEEEEEKLFHETREELSHQIFSIEEWPLFDIRATIFRDGTYKIHYSIDALIMDAGSAIILLEEFNKLYYNSDIILPENSISFRDYVISESKFQETKLFNRSKKYWLERINTIPLAPELQIDISSARSAKPRFERRESCLDKKQWDKLQYEANKIEITPTVLLLACFSEVLYQWSKLPNFTINLTFFNRIPFHSNVNSIIGDFTSLILLEVDFREKDAFINRLKRLQNRMWSDIENRYYSGVEVLRQMSRVRNNTVIMPVVVTSTLGLNIIEDLIEGKQVIEQLEFTNDDKKKPFSITQTPQVWIDFQIREDSNGLSYNWDSIEGLFPQGMLDDMFETFDCLLKSLINDKEVLKSKSIIPLPRNQASIRLEVNSTADKVSNKLLHELFKDQVIKRSHAIAIETMEHTITYGELSHMCNVIGGNLRAQGAIPNKLVAIVMEKCWEQVVGSMGILYSGAAYLPIDATLPQDRILLLLEQGEVDIIVTTPNIAERINFPENKKVLRVEKSLLLFENNQLDFIQKPNDIAYVIFTSGSTGIPKGVIIDHKGAVNTILDINSRFNISENDKVFALSSLSFDLSVYDIFGLLGAGGSIVIPKHDETKNPEIWQEYIIQYSITLWNTVPALMQMLVEYVEQNTHGIDSLRLVLMSGDWIPLKLPERIKSLNKSIDVINLGGATEASIWSIWHRIDEIDPNWRSIPYGKPLKNQKFYVLKPDLSECPDHVPGELYIGGIGLALGYWKDEIKTDKSFIVHPETKERLYRTGDKGRFFPDGNIEFLGREDNQVKIQGYRIELGEIESALKMYDNINDAIVITSGEKGDVKELIAYIIPQQNAMSSELIINSSEDSIGELKNSGNTIIDKYERTLFKLNKHGLRKIENPLSVVPLIKPGDRFLTLSCKTNDCNSFIKETINFKEFCKVFDCLLPCEIEGLLLPKYYYPSAGSLYPVQTYVCVKPERIKGVEGGYYYYNQQKHCLEQISVYNDNYQLANVNMDIDHHAFTIYFISDINAIRPLYGIYSEIFCYQEAGYMANLLLNSNNQNIVMRYNKTVDTKEVFKVFSLSSNHTYHCSFTGGIEANKKSINPIFSHEVKSQIKNTEQDNKIQISYLERKSYREFRGKDFITQKELEIILNEVISSGIARSDNQKLVKSFLYVKENKVEGLSKGVYLLNPCKHGVEFLQSEVDGKLIFSGNESIYDSSSFAIILTGSKDINDSRKEALFLTGYIGQSIMNISTKYQIGVCAIGTVNQSYSRKILKLSENEEVLHSLMAGRIMNEQIESIEQIVEKDKQEEGLEQLKIFLRKHLPSYMIPSHFIFLKEFPLTYNGKIDRIALPNPKIQIDENYIAPSSEIEAKLVELWADVLKIDKNLIGVNKNFFELGGNSLKVIQLHSAINKTFSWNISIPEMFQYITISAITKYVTNSHENTGDTIEVINEELNKLESIINDYQNINLYE